MNSSSRAPGQVNAAVEVRLLPDGRTAEVTHSGGATVIGTVNGELVQWFKDLKIDNISLYAHEQGEFHIPLEEGLVLAVVMPLSPNDGQLNQRPQDITGVIIPVEDEYVDIKPGETKEIAKKRDIIETYEQAAAAFTKKPNDTFFVTFAMVGAAA